jgi:hypothetical protein
MVLEDRVKSGTTSGRKKYGETEFQYGTASSVDYSFIGFVLGLRYPPHYSLLIYRHYIGLSISGHIMTANHIPLRTITCDSLVTDNQRNFNRYHFQTTIVSTGFLGEILRTKK